MARDAYDPDTASFLKSLGFPEMVVHHSFNHFDFVRPGRRILVIGPMGSGKTEYSSRVWRDAGVARQKSGMIRGMTTNGKADRRNVFFIRSILDAGRFPEYPIDALAYRGGFESCGDRIALISDSYDLERIIDENPDVGTWIVDEASFYDERIVYVIRNASERQGLIFIFPSLILNFRKDIFNSTARLMIENATDVFPLTAYCEHPDCIADSFYTYRYYRVDGQECPAFYFDPLIVIGGDRVKDDPREPNYCTRCDEHHLLPGKEYTYFILKPLGRKFSRGDTTPLLKEIRALHENGETSALYGHMKEKYGSNGHGDVYMNALRVPCIAEKALIYLFSEQNLLAEDKLREISKDLELDSGYLEASLSSNGRPVLLER